MMKHSVVMPIRVDHDWQIPMTECAIKTLKSTTSLPFEFIIVEYLNDQFAHHADNHIQIKTPIGPNAECNLGFEAAEGEYLVYAQNDLFVRPGWLEALQEPFDEIKDCGIATLASADLHGKLPFPMPCKLIVEGVYGPFMMFRKGWKFDADTFPCQFGDTDLVMRTYEAGWRSYRNYAVVIQHLNRATTAGPENDADFQAARKRFAAKHQKSPLLMYQYLTGGQIV